MRSVQMKSALLALIITLSAVPGLAQGSFSFDLYGELLDRADTSYSAGEAAEGTLEGFMLFNEALTLKEQAADMLLEAFQSGVIGPSEGFYEAALGDHFNLRENIQFLYNLLDRCAQAQLALNLLLEESVFIPASSEDSIDRMHENIATCTERVSAVGVNSSAEEQWAMGTDRFLLLISEADSYAALAQAGDESQMDNSIQRRSVAISLLRSVMSPDENQMRGHSAGDLFAQYDRLIADLVETEDCESADQIYNQASEDRESLEAQGGEAGAVAFTGQMSAIDRCLGRDGNALLQDSLETPPPLLSANVDVSLPAYILLGLGGALSLSAGGLDIATMGDRDELDMIRDACLVGDCDYDQAVSLSESIDSRKITIGVLAGSGLVSGVVGLVLLLLDDGDEEDAAESARSRQLNGVFSGDSVGIGMSF